MKLKLKLKLKLKSVAKIKLGASFRSGVKVAANSSLRLVQMRDLVGHAVSLKRAVSIDATGKNTDSLIQPGDILFRSRGRNYTAAIYEGKEGRALVAAPLLLVRPNIMLVEPRYLLWWLNHPSSQHYFRSHAEGSASQMVSKKTLENFEISLPPLARQRSLADYFVLASREERLLGKIQRLRAQHAQGVLMHLATTGSGADNANLEASTVAPPSPRK